MPTHVLADAHCGLSELRTYGHIILHIASDRLRAFEEEVK
jgi:hypothetical protein